MAGLYIHIPFCKTRCIYCDFYSQTNCNDMNGYVDCLLQEWTLRRCELGGTPLKTIYIGGGTPSQLSENAIERLIGGLKSLGATGEVVEFTVEVNPDDVTTDYMALLKRLGVNRVSMGVQSFCDNELRFIGRRHSALDACRAVETINGAGINNISIDLMYGLPMQTLDSLSRSVKQALKIKPSHISAYCLSYEEGTPLWRLRECGRVQETDEETIIEMGNMLTELLEDAGYEHYEISNFCLPGMHSRHNSAYWSDAPYLGLGASAHGYDGKVRRYNVPDITQYMQRINAGKTAYETEQLEWWEQFDETIMVRLRTRQGLDLNLVEKRFGRQAKEHALTSAQPHIVVGHMTLADDVLRLTRSGIMFSDSIIRDLMWPV